jgi:hypothetical protein
MLPDAPTDWHSQNLFWPTLDDDIGGDEPRPFASYVLLNISDALKEIAVMEPRAV